MLNREMQTSVIQYYCKSLEYGCKHIHQSLPRLLFIWFDYAANKPNEDTSKRMGQCLSVLTTYTAVVRDMTTLIGKSFSLVFRMTFDMNLRKLILKVYYCIFILNWSEPLRKSSCIYFPYWVFSNYFTNLSLQFKCLGSIETYDCGNCVGSSTPSSLDDDSCL